MTRYIWYSIFYTQQDPDRLLQDVDINRLRAVVFRDVVGVLRSGLVWRGIASSNLCLMRTFASVSTVCRTTASRLSFWLWQWFTLYQFSWCQSTGTSWNHSGRSAGPPAYQGEAFAMRSTHPPVQVILVSLFAAVWEGYCELLSGDSCALLLGL